MIAHRGGRRNSPELPGIIGARREIAKNRRFSADFPRLFALALCARPGIIAA